MASSTQTAAADCGSVAATSIALLARIGAKAHAALKALQTARLHSALSNMSDHQLAQIGISRSDIPTYAETLMANE